MTYGEGQISAASPLLCLYSVVQKTPPQNATCRGPNRFQPGHRIHSIFIEAYLFVNESKLMTVCPIPHHVSILPIC